MSAEDSGAHPIFEFGARSAGDLVDAYDRMWRRYPDMAHEQRAHNIADANHRYGHAAQLARIPAALIEALREGITCARYIIPIASAEVSITVTRDRTPPHDKAREVEVWDALRRLVNDVNNQPTEQCAYVVRDDLPPEIGIAVWERDGERVYACRPGHASTALRASRSGPTYRALAPVAAVFAGLWAKATHGIAQATVGGITAAGLTVAPPVPIPNHQPMPSPWITPVVDDSEARRLKPVRATPGKPARSRTPQGNDMPRRNRQATPRPRWGSPPTAPARPAQTGPGQRPQATPGRPSSGSAKRSFAADECDGGRGPGAGQVDNGRDHRARQ